MRTIDDYVQLLIDQPHNRYMQELDKFDEMLGKLREMRPTELRNFKPHMEKMTAFKGRFDAFKYNMEVNAIVTAIQQDMSALTEQWMQERDDQYAVIDNQLETLRIQIEESNKAHNLSIKNANVESNKGYNVLEEKRLELQSYSDRIFDMCSQYGITTSDMAVHEGMFTFDELNNLYDEYIKYLQKDVNKGNIIRTVRRVVPNASIQGIILLGMLALCFTQLLDALAVVFFGLLAFNQRKNIQRVKYYSVLMGITFNVDPKAMGFTAFDESQLLPEELTDEMLDTDERFSMFEQMYQDVENNFEGRNPANSLAQLMNELEQRRPELNRKLADFSKAWANKQAAIRSDIDSEIAFCNQEYERLKNEFKTVGERFSPHLYFSDEYVLGLHDDCIEECVTVGMHNIIFRPAQDEAQMNAFMRVMVANALCNVFPGKLKIYIYDPNGMGRSFMAFYNQYLSNYMEFNNDNLDNTLTPLIEQTQQNFKDMGGQDIQTFNKECEEVGKTPKDYNLLIVMSQPKTIEEDEKLKSFFEYSASGGTFIWVVSNIMQANDAFTFRIPFEGVQNPLKGIDDKWCQKVTKNFLEAIDKMKTPALFWEDFMANVIPANKMWTGDANRELEFYPGYLNGDPTSYKPYTIGNEGNVHVIGVGGTGAGKSVFLNHLVTSVCTLYPPWEVELWLCDFKGVEFKAYLNNDEHPFMLPHIQACLCTSDPDFATSLFKAFRDKADHRYDDMKIMGVKNMPSWNQLIKTRIGQPKPEELVSLHVNDWKEVDFNPVWSEADLWPRTVLICDEFQVIFQKADPKNLESINADITQISKVARAAGCHIFFTSQSMKGTVSDDILQQFTLRFALRCDKEVSMSILGTSRASDIREKNGYLIVRSVEMSLEDQKRYRTPFLNDSPAKQPGPDGKKYSQLHRVIQGIYERAVNENYKFRDVISYEESTKHPIAELEAIYKNPEMAAKLPSNYGVFFLGMRMAYSANKAPDNIIMSAQSNENVFSVFSDYTDFVLFFRTMITNINCNEVSGNVIINSQIRDIAYICEAENYITNPKHEYLLSDKVSCEDMITWMEDLLEYRKSKEIKDKPVWIFLLGWDKGKGIGVESDGGTKARLNTILQTCGETNMHIIMICTSVSAISIGTIEACKYRIAGKCAVDESLTIIGTKQAGVVYDGMKTGWLFKWVGGEVTRDKLYISKIEREIAKREVRF